LDISRVAEQEEIMLINRRAMLAAGLAVPAFAGIGLCQRRAFALTPQQELVEKSRLTFEKLIASPEFAELPGYVKRAKGVMIFPELVKASFVVGGEGGSGVLLVRKDMEWSQPAFYTLAAGSVGLQFGGQLSEVVLTIMSERAIDAVIDNQMKFGGDISIAVGPIGKGLGADTTTNMDADVYTFAKTAGFFGGISLEGAGILKRESWNSAYYGQGATPYAILIEGKFLNPNAQALRDSLAAY
jgi:lipid-binding SYLF domain-containing protein